MQILRERLRLLNSNYITCNLKFNTEKKIVQEFDGVSIYLFIREIGSPCKISCFIQNVHS